MEITENNANVTEDNIANLHDMFAEFAKDKCNLRYYKYDFSELSENFYGNVEVNIQNIITELSLSCIVSYENNCEDFFNRIINIIQDIERIQKHCSLMYSGSGEYGYGLELI